ncbi:MAG: Ig-like domain-containing protein, partial [Bacteroidota bacterium]
MMRKNIYLAASVMLLLSSCDIEEVTIPPEPVVRIVQPGDRAMLSDSTFVVVEASDDKGILRVDLFIDGKPAPKGALLYEPYTYVWDLKGYADSSVHELYARAMDIDSLTTNSQKITVTNLRLTPTNFRSKMIGDTVVRLLWNDVSTIETNYQIFYNDPDSGFVLIRNLPANSTSVDIPGIYYSNQHYTYILRALSGNRKSLESSEVTTFPVLLGLDTIHVVEQRDDSLEVTWGSSFSVFPVRTEIELSINNGPYAVVAVVPPGPNTATIRGPFTAGVSHRLRARWFSKYNSSPYNTPQTTYLSLPAPSRLSYQPLIPSGFLLKWQDNSTYEKGFSIERKTSSNPSFTEIARVGSDVTSWQDNDVDTNHTYSYRMRAFTDYNVTTYTDAVTIAYFPDYTELTTIDAHAGGVTSVEFLPGSGSLYSAGKDGSVKQWDPQTGNELSSLLPSAGAVECMTLSHDGTKIAVGGDDHTVKIFDRGTSSLLHTLQGHTQKIASLDFTEDDAALISGSADSTVKLWNTAAGTLVQTLPRFSGAVNAVSSDPQSGNIAIAGGDGSVTVWKTNGSIVQWSQKDSLNIPMALSYNHAGTAIGIGRYGTDNPIRVLSSSGILTAT